LLEGEWGVLELDLGLLSEGVREPVTYDPVIPFPPLRQELAVVVDVDVPAGSLLAAAREAVPEATDVRFLSDYRDSPIPEGKKSIAFSIAYQAPDRTLTDAEAVPLRARVIEALERRFGAELRA
jgi:phenylalanyl-tRNA synthetase beta chain